jgi:hypothetical protein
MDLPTGGIIITAGDYLEEEVTSYQANAVFAALQSAFTRSNTPERSE